MPMLVRATTTNNAQGRQQRLHLPSTLKSNELDADYLHTLKVRFSTLFFIFSIAVLGHRSNSTGISIDSFDCQEASSTTKISIILSTIGYIIPRWSRSNG